MSQKEKWIPKIGDRVAAYREKRRVGVIVHFDSSDNTYRVDECYWYHRKQIRRLIKKEKKKPREFWLNIYPNVTCAHSSESRANETGNRRIECVHVREVLE